MSPDKVLLEGMVFYGHHGVADAERELGQRFVVDVEVTCDLRAASDSDDLKDTTNYAQVYRLAEQVMTGEPRRLLESLAQTIASRVLERFARAEAVRVKVRKPEVPIRGSVLEHAAVEVLRDRGDPA